MTRNYSFLIIDTSYPINNRNEKIISSLSTHFDGPCVNVVTWDKRNICESIPNNYRVYSKYCRPGNKIKKFTWIFEYKHFVKKCVDDLKPDVIIASHWDSLFCVPPKNNNSLVVYDNIDVPDGSTPVRYTELFLEKISLSKASLILHASRFFKELYKDIKTEQIVLENKPVFPIVKRDDEHNMPFVISFIGTLRYYETLTKLIDAIKGDKRYLLNFYGNGPDEDRLRSYCAGLDNVFFYGRYNYKDIIPFYEKSDLIWAVYPSKDFNVRYAISNKFYESMFLGVPAVFADNTLLGDYVKEKGIGYTVNAYSSVSIKELLNEISLNKDEKSSIRKNMYVQACSESLWEEDFKIVSDKIKIYLDER